MKRSGKFYRNNERVVMEELGFTPTPNSGSGWIVKEDGQNDNAICQLKSTDAMSIKVNLEDIHTLQYNAQVAHKIPVFAIQFLKTDEVFLLVKAKDMEEIINYIKTGERKTIIDDVVSTCDLDSGSNARRTKIKSSDSARESIRREMENKYRKKERKAK